MKKFTRQENRYYFFLMKLFGLTMEKTDFEAAFGENCDKALWGEILFLKLAGALEETDTTIKLTDKGRYYWVMAMREFFIAVDTMRDYCRALVAF